VGIDGSGAQGLHDNRYRRFVFIFKPRDIRSNPNQTRQAVTNRKRPTQKSIGQPERDEIPLAQRPVDPLSIARATNKHNCCTVKQR
jgi:hypothetical protein